MTQCECKNISGISIRRHIRHFPKSPATPITHRYSSSFLLPFESTFNWQFMCFAHSFAMNSYHFPTSLEGSSHTKNCAWCLCACVWVCMSEGRNILVIIFHLSFSLRTKPFFNFFFTFIIHSHFAIAFSFFGVFQYTCKHKMIYSTFWINYIYWYRHVWSLSPNYINGNHKTVWNKNMHANGTWVHFQLKFSNGKYEFITI